MNFFRAADILADADAIGDPLETLQQLQALPEEQRRSVQYGEALVRVLEAARSDEAVEVRRALIAPKNQEFLTEAAQQHRTVAYVFALVLVEAAEEGFLEGKKAEAAALLALSRKVHEQPTQQRDELQQLLEQKGDSPVLLAAVVVLLAAGGGVFVYLRRRYEDVADGEDALEERAADDELSVFRRKREQRELRETFRIDANDSQDVLKKRYEELSAEAESDGERVELARKYDRAVQLLFDND